MLEPVGKVPPMPVLVEGTMVEEPLRGFASERGPFPKELSEERPPISGTEILPVCGLSARRL